MMAACWSVAVVVYFMAGRSTQILIALAAFTSAHLLVALLVHRQLQLLAASGAVSMLS